MPADSEVKTNNWRDLGIMVGVITIVCVLWLLFGAIPWWGEQHWRWEEPNVVGDSFGFANSLFSGLALAGVVVAIYLQRLELQEQRRELRLTKEELSRSADAQEQTQRTMLVTAYLQAAAKEMEVAEQSASHTMSVTSAENRETWRREVTRIQAHALLRHVQRGDLPESIAAGTLRELHFGLLDSFEWFVAKLSREGDTSELKLLASRFRDRVRVVVRCAPRESASDSLVNDLRDSQRELNGLLESDATDSEKTALVLYDIAKRLAEHFSDDSTIVAESIGIINRRRKEKQ